MQRGIREDLHLMRGTRLASLAILLVLSSCSGALLHDDRNEPATTNASEVSAHDGLIAVNQKLSREVTQLRQELIRIKQGIADRRAQRLALHQNEHVMLKDNLVHTILFRSGYMELTSQNHQDIKELAAELRSLPDIKSIDVLGYTDPEPIGGYPKHRHKKRHPYKSNMALSQARAVNVTNELIAAGLPENMVHLKGLGTTSNRRVEIHLIRN